MTHAVHAAAKASNGLVKPNRSDALFMAVTAEAAEAAPMISHPPAPIQKEVTDGYFLFASLRTNTALTPPTASLMARVAWCRPNPPSRRRLDRACVHS